MIAPNHPKFRATLLLPREIEESLRDIRHRSAQWLNESAEVLPVPLAQSSRRRRL